MRQDHPPDFFDDDIRRLIGVDDTHALRCRRGALEVGLPNAVVEILPLDFETIERTRLRGDAPGGQLDRQIEQERQVGLQVRMHPGFELNEFFPVKTAATALIGVSGVAETIADDPVAARQRRFNDLRQVFPAGSEHQQGFGFEVHRLTEQQLPQLLAERRAPRFAAGDDLQSALAQEVGQFLQMAAFTGTVDAFKSDESAALHIHERPPRW